MKYYAEALNYIFGLNSNRRIFLKFGFERMEKVLSALHNPQDSLNSVHIAGTKGKGSTISFLSFILREKYSTGLFTSPSLVNTNERISINGELIPPADFLYYANLLRDFYKKLNPDDVPTTFETFTIMAFLYFNDKKTDISLFEVGMGGRLDATNIIKKPLVSVITPISYDHQNLLGSTLSQIAEEKAGIIKENVPVIVGKQENEALIKILEVAERKNSQPVIYGKDFLIDNFKEDEHGIEFDFKSLSSDVCFRGLKAKLYGKHQAENAAVAIQTALVLSKMGYKIEESDIRRGLKKAFWPGRLEVVSHSPFIILDGAHNGASARALNSALNLMKSGRKIFVLGILKDKNVDDVLSELAKDRDAIFVLTEVPFSGKRRLPVHILKAFVKKYVPAKNIFYFRDFTKAFFFSQRMAKDSDIICVTGSLYLVASVRKLTNHFVFSSNIL